MKKSKFFAVLAAVLVGAISLTSCVQAYPNDVAQADISAFYLRGGMNGWANGSLDDGKLTKEDGGVFTREFEANDTSIEFAIADADWSSKFCNGTVIAADTDYVEVAAGGDNAKVTGLTIGSKYKMLILPLEKSVKIKVVTTSAAAATPDTLTVTINGAAVSGGLNVYAWSSDFLEGKSDADLFGGWSGFALSRIGNSNTFCADVTWSDMKAAISETGTINLIFNGSALSDQTGNVPLTASEMTGSITYIIDAATNAVTKL